MNDAIWTAVVGGLATGLGYVLREVIRIRMGLKSNSATTEQTLKELGTIRVSFNGVLEAQRKLQEERIAASEANVLCLLQRIATMEHLLAILAGKLNSTTKKGSTDAS